MEPCFPEAHELSRAQDRHRRVLHFEYVLISANRVGSLRKDCSQDVRVVFRVTGVRGYPFEVACRHFVNKGKEKGRSTKAPAGSRLRRLRLLFGAGHSAEDLDGHPKVAQGVEVGDVNPAVLTAEHHAVLALCPPNGLAEVRCGEGDVVHALALLGED